MTKYLLLRDNKQSGPFLLDELRTNGLKPYDLVWIEGKSAAWRYPSEIEEMMPFAPVVEEQPFDRFYKKSTQANSGHVVSANSAVGQSNNNTLAQSRPVPSSVTGEESTIPGKKIIYVTMPAGKPAPVVRDPGPREQSGNLAFPQDRPAPSPLVKETGPAGRVPVGTGKATAAPIKEDTDTRYTTSNWSRPVHATPAAVENFSLPHEDWKESVEIAPRAKKRGWTRPVQLLVLGTGIIVLLGAGIFIGLSINKEDLGFTRRTGAMDLAANPATASTVQPAAAPSSTIPVTLSVTNAAAPPIVQSGGPVIGATTASAAAASHNSPATAVNRARKQPLSNGKIADNEQAKALMVSTAQASVKDSPDAMTTLPTGQREASHRADAAVPADKEALKPNIANLVSVSANGYSIGTFGGISDLQLTVSNHSSFPLDLVVVEVQYIQANKKVFKTEHLNFPNIGAGSAMMLEAPKTPRGIKVQYRITVINSKESGLSYSAI
jgi:hypothetical protein